MSLVSEALKKAEREAAARAARAAGGNPPAPLDAPLQPYRAPRGARAPRRAALVGIALLCAALALGWWSSSRKDSVKGAVAEPTAGLSAPSSANATPPPPRESAPQPGSATASGLVPAPPSASEPPPVTLATPPLPRTTQQPPLPSPSASESPTTPPATILLPKDTQQRPQPTSSASAPQAPQQPPPPAPSAPAREPSNVSGDFLRSVEFADGSSLELGGIVFSEEAPFAYINGRLVGVGEFVLGRRIDRIERERVILSGESGEISLRLK